MTSCYCSVEVEDPADFYSATKRIARKKHVCGECREAITPGNEYERVTGLWDGTWATYKTCHLCLRIRDDLFPCGWYFEQMREEIRECLGFDYVTGESMYDDDEEDAAHHG